MSGARVTRAAIVLAIVGAASSARADAHKVFVLPLDGNAEPALRSKLASDVRDLATSEGNAVSAGDATLDETAAAVGCQPDKQACVDQVIATLGVDEVVWGSATTTNGTTQVVIHREMKGAPARTVSAVIQPNETTDAVKPVVAPMFGQPGKAAPDAPRPRPTEATPDRKIGLAFVAGGGAMLIISFVLWGNAHTVQGTIDSASTQTIADIQALKQLEDRAAGYALAGNVLFVVALAAGGAGAYFLWRDHNHRTTIVPVANEHGASVVLRGAW